MTMSDALAATAAKRSAWALGAGLALLPFLSHLPVDVDRGGVIVFLPALWLGRHTGFWRLSPAVARWLAALIAIAVAATALGDHPAPGFVYGASTGLIVATALLARQVASFPSAAKILLGAIVTSAAVTCVLIWATWRQGTPMNDFPHYTHVRLFGLHMLIATMAGFVALGLWPQPGTARRLVWLATVIACGGLLWSGGRAPLAGFAIGGAIWCWVGGKAHRVTRLRIFALVLVGGLLLSLLRWSPEPYLGWWSAFQRSASATSVDELTSTRLSFWQVTWNSFLEKPWIGHGADSYRFIVPKQDGHQPHNWPLQLLHDFGLVGAGLVAWWLVRRLYSNFRVASAAPSGSLTLDCTAGLLACLVGGLFDGVFYHLVLLGPAAMFAGLALADNSSDFIASRQISRVGWAAVASATSVLCLHGYLVFSLLSASPPETPHAAPARLLRVFPTTTLALESWLDRWRRPHPAETLEWTRWAVRHSDNPAQLHVYAAVLYVNRRDFESALREGEAALRTVHLRSRPQVERFLQDIEQVREKSRHPPPQPTR